MLPKKCVHPFDKSICVVKTGNDEFSRFSLLWSSAEAAIMPTQLPASAAGASRPKA